VGEDGGDGEAAWALDIHEEGSWSWNKVLVVGLVSEKSFQSVSYAYLQLVAASLSGRGWVEEVNGENLLTKLSQHLSLPICSS
jgi:hypothetical protein